MLKILIIKRGALGDILMTTPLIRQLKINLPDATIDYCCAKSFASVLENNSYLNQLILLEDQAFSLRGIFKYLKFVMNARRNYDYIFNLGKNWQLQLLNLLFHGQKIGFARNKISQLLLNKFIFYNDVYRYHVLYNLDLLAISKLAIPDYSDIQLDLLINSIDKNVVNQKMQQLNLTKFIVIVNSGGNNYYETSGIRMLPTNKMQELIKLKLQQGNKIILLGGNIDKHNYNQYALDDTTNIYNMAGEFNLAQSCYLISLAQEFYTTDCGAMHLGVMAKLGNKMTCFFGPTCPNHVLPPMNDYNIVWQDQDIFDKEYPLSGKTYSINNNFFTKLEVKEVVTEMNTDHT